MKEIFTIIFSLDRPAQLDLLLRTIRNFDKEDKLDLLVLYNFTNDEYQIGYQRLQEIFNTVKFIKETDYTPKKKINPLQGDFTFNLFYWIINYRYRNAKSNFNCLLTNSILNSKARFVMFLTDDSIFYRDINLDENCLKLIDLNPHLAYCLANGENIKGYEGDIANGYLYWNFERKKTFDFWNYPFSVDGRIYNKTCIQRIFSKCLFSNPNTLETIVVKYNKLHKHFSGGIANIKSCLIGFELNRVQTMFNNNSLLIDPKILNNLFLQGYELNLEYSDQKIESFRPPLFRVLMKKEHQEIIIFEDPSFQRMINC